jgi:hypothetical protein
MAAIPHCPFLVLCHLLVAQFERRQPLLGSNFRMICRAHSVGTWHDASVADRHDLRVGIEAWRVSRGWRSREEREEPSERFGGREFWIAGPPTAGCILVEPNMRLDALFSLPTDPDHVLAALVVSAGDDFRYASLQIGQSAANLQVGDGHESEAVTRHGRRA